MGRYLKAFLFLFLIAGAIIGLMSWLSEARLERSLPPEMRSSAHERPNLENQAAAVGLSYDDMVETCRDSIQVWGEARGTVPSDALAMLRQLKAKETGDGRHSEGADKSSELAGVLIPKMVTAMEKWEIAGDDQKPVSSDRAQACYRLSLELAEAIESVRREVLGMTDGGMGSEIDRLRNKIDGLD